MVAIVSGNSLGVNLTSHQTLGLPLGASSAHGRNGQASYVNVATGNLVIQNVEDTLAARGIDATALRTYNSQGLFNDDNADNWCTGFVSQPLRLTGSLNAVASTLARTDRDGSTATYHFEAATGLYRTSQGGGAHDTIVYVAAENQLEWRDGGTGLTQRYQAAGAFRLLATVDPTGYRVNYAYDAQGRIASESSGSGEMREYTYTAAGNLDRVVTSRAEGTPLSYVQYLYDASNRLVKAVVDHTPGDLSVSDLHRYETDYGYDGSSKRIASITQSDGTRLDFSYVDVGGGNFKLASVRNALDQVTTFTYGTGSSTVTDALGLVTRYEFDGSGQITRISAPAVAGVSATQTFSYAANGDVLSITDGAGRSTTFAYDAQGNRVLQRDTVGNTIRRTFDLRNQLLTETIYLQVDPDGTGAAEPGQPLTTRFVYDATRAGLLRFSVNAEGGVTEHRYNALGDRVSTIVYTSAAYPVEGLAAGAVPTQAAMSTWCLGQDLTRTERTDMSYDAQGQLRVRTTYASVDGTGTGIGAAAVEQFVRDASGRVLQTVNPGTGTTQYTYDGLGRVLTQTNALGQVTATQYDDAGRRTLMLGANGLVTTTRYDAAGRLVSVARSDVAAALLGETRYFHDGGGRLRMTQDPTGVRHWMVYDGEGRKTGDVDGNGSLTEYVYDRSGRLTGTTRYATTVDTAALVDAGGAPVLPLTVASLRPASASSDVQTWNAYDAAGRLVRTARTVGTGTSVAVTQTDYDGASRVIRTTQFATQVAAAAVVPGTIPVPVSSPSDRIVRHFHDDTGALEGILDAEGFLTSYLRDAAGREVQTVKYATVTAQAHRLAGTLGQLRPPASSSDITTFAYHDAMGRRIAEVDGEGYLTEWTYDAAGNVSSVLRHAQRISTTATTASTVGSLRPAPTASDQVATRTYDLLGRLVEETGIDGVVTRYAYDAAGQLVSTVRAVNTAETRALLVRYDLQGRMVGELSAQGASLLTGGESQPQVDAIWVQYGTSHTYDAAGRRASSSDAAGNTRWFYYDADDSLRYTINALGEVQERRYDGLGRLSQEVAYAARATVRGPGGLLAGTISLVADAARDSVTNYTYARDGAVASVTDAEANVTSIQYNSFSEEIGRAQGLSAGVSLTQVHTLDRRGLRTSTLSDPAGIAALQTATYDAFGRLTRNVDANGNVRVQEYDRLGRLVVTRDPLGGVRSTSYDAYGRQLVRVDALGKATTLQYDAAARTVTVTTAEGVRTTTTYSRHGQVHSVLDGRGATTTYAYDHDGRLLVTTSAAGAQSSSYDAAGRLLETRDAAGHRTVYSYDAANRTLSRTVDPAGLALSTRYAYDAKGQAVAVTDPNGTVTAYTFDRKGRVVTETVDPAGLALRTTFTHDADGRVLTVTSPGATKTQYVFDAMGRRTSERVDPGGLDLQRTWTYDAQGNAVSARDPAGNVTRFAYDANGRLVFRVDAAGGIVQHAYDAEGREIRTRRYAAALTLASLPGTPSASDIQSRVVSGSGDIVEHRLYDADGRMTASVDGTGGTVKYTYDANGNVVERRAFANAIDLAAWNGTDHPAPLPDTARDQRAINVYDASNRAVFTMDGTGAVTALRYDANGAVIERVTYARHFPPDTIATVEAFTSALAAMVAPGRDVQVRYSYDAAGRLVAAADGVGSVQRRSYDRNGNVLQEAALATAIDVSTDPAAAVTSPADRIRRHAYDAANRRVISIDPEGAATRTHYDANGKAVSTTAYAARVDLSMLATWSGVPVSLATHAEDRTIGYAYDAAGRLVFEIDALRQVKKNSYDANGLLIESRRHEPPIDASIARTVPAILAALSNGAADRLERHTYDAMGRRTSTTDALGRIEMWSYDALGNKASFTDKKGSTWYYEYDAAGRLLRERSPSAKLFSTSWDSATQTIAADGARNANVVTALRYDGIGNLTQRTEALGLVEERTTRYEYDAAARQVRVIYPEVGVYDAASDNYLANDGVSPRREFAARALESRTYYDALGNAVANRDVGGGLSQKVYDRAGRLIYEVDAAGYVTGYTYDVFGSATTLTRYGSGTTLAQRPLASAAQAVTQTELEVSLNDNGFSHAANRVLRSAYDHAGRVAETWQPGAFVYDAVLGLQETNVSARTRHRYNAFGELIQVSKSRDASATLWYETYHYRDALGREKATIDAAGHVTTRQFDAFGNLERLTERATPAAPGSWNLDAYAAPASSSADRTTAYGYDRLDRKVFETRVAVEYSVASTASAVTGNTTTTFAYDALGNQTSVTDALGETSLTYYDALGRVEATATPFQVANASKKVTEFRRDAHGNVVVTVERSTPAAVTASNYDAPAAGTDRSAITRFDALGRAVATRDANGAMAFTSYDAHGRAAKTWRPVTDAQGRTRTQFQINVYDALGQLVETRTPASTTVVQGGLQAAYTPYVDYGDVVQGVPARVALQWSDLVEPQGGGVRIEVDYVVTTQVLKYVWGSEVYVPESRVVTARRDLAAWEAAAGAEVTWNEKADRVASIRVLQFADGQWRSRWEGTLASAAGSGVTVLSQADAGFVSLRQEFNAFGEMTRRGTQGGAEEYTDYDAAGRAWRTNAGDGVDRVLLHDLQGNITAEIRSSGAGGVNQDVRAYQSAHSAAVDPYSRRVDIRYDALGHVASRTEAARSESRGATYAHQQFVAATLTTATPIGDLQTASAWNGLNRVAFSWNSLAPLGSGDVRVAIEYRTPITRHGGVFDAEFGFVTPVSYSGGVSRSYTSGVIDGTLNAAGTVLAWAETSGTPDGGGIGQITRIRVEKKDGNGIWRDVIDQGLGYGAQEIIVAVPTEPGTAVALETRPNGAGAWNAVSSPAFHFGDAYRYEISAWTLGSHEYRVRTAVAGQPPETTASGTVTVAQPLLAAITTPIAFTSYPAGRMYWAHQDFSIQQVMRYRPAAGGAWSTLPVSVFGFNSDLDGVDTAQLGQGTYQFELLWTMPGDSSPSKHATGSFTIQGAQPAYTIPASGTPAITGLALGTLVIPGQYLGGDEANSYYSPPQYVTGLFWNACNATLARATANGSTWINLPIDNTQQYRDELTHIYYGRQGIGLHALPPNQYRIEVYANGRWATANYGSVGGATLSVTTPPYVPAQYVPARPATYSVSANTPAMSSPLSTTAGRSLVVQASMNLGNRLFRPEVIQNTDRWGNVVSISDPRSANWVTTYRYNANNQLVRQIQVATSSLGAPVTDIFYDALGRQVAVRDANGNVNGQAYDAAGNVAEERQANGGVIRHVHDAFGRKVQTTDPGSRVVRYEYDKAGNLLAVDRGSAPTYAAVDGGAVIWAGVLPIRDQWTYDQLGQKLTHTNGNGERLTYTYDLRGNVVETLQPMGQKTRSAFDANGRKTAELDANGYVTRWTYDFFGQLTAHSDLGGARYVYTYDNARQLALQRNTRGQYLQYGYDSAGQLTRIHDAALNQTTTYMHDAGGRHIRERVVQNGAIYQDNHLAYDELGRLRDVADARVHVSLWYDRVGNRTRIKTDVGFRGVSGADVAAPVDRYFMYDALNRQTVVDGINANGDIGYDRGHAIAYDASGNRMVDAVWGKRVVSANGAPAVVHYNDDSDGTGVPDHSLTFVQTEGWSTEVYRYDAANRLQSIVRDGVMVNHRRYDGADRLLFSGPASLPAGYAPVVRAGLGPTENDGLDQTYNRYDANGRLLQQRTIKSDLTARSLVSWDASLDLGGGVRAAGYDGVGNAKGYAVKDLQSGATTTYNTTFKRFEGHQAGETSAASPNMSPGKTTHGYDTNGYLVSLRDASMGANNRDFVNDSAGRALYVSQGGHVQRQLIVNGEVMGLYGAGINEKTPKKTDGNPNFADIVDFELGYAPIQSNYPHASPGTYVIRAGDSLQSVAQAAYGDSALWYRIAEANGLATSTDLKVGQTLSIPNRVGTIHNNNTTFEPYDPSKITGDVTPNLPMPKEGCGGVGQLLMVIVAIVVTIYTAGAAAGALGTASATGGAVTTFNTGLAALAGGTATVNGVAVTISATAGGALATGTAVSMASAAIGAAAGSIAGQGIGIAAGLQSKFDWKGVALSALSGGITAGLASPGSLLAGSTSGAVVTRAVAGSLATQAVGVALGIQPRFSWRGVAASAVGASVSQAVGNALGVAWSGTAQGDFAARAVTGLLAGTAAAATRGGRVVAQQIAVDAFGNVLGTSLAGASTATAIVTRDPLDDLIDMQLPAWEQRQATFDGIVDAFARDYSGRLPGVNVAAAGLDRLVLQEVPGASIDLPGTQEALKAWVEMKQRATQEHRRQNWIANENLVGDRVQSDLAGLPIRITTTPIVPYEGGLIEVLSTGFSHLEAPSEAFQTLGVAAESTVRAVTELPLMVVDLVQAAADVAHRTASANALDPTMYSAMGRAAQAGATVGESLQGLNPMYGLLVAQHDARQGLERGDKKPLAAFGGSLFGATVAGMGMTRIPAATPRIATSHQLPTFGSQQPPVRPTRPSWRISEQDLETMYGQSGYTAQLSFLRGQPVSRGTAGSTRPDLYALGESIDIKNYNLVTARGQRSLVHDVVTQAQHRTQNLPSGDVQKVVIDTRGQNISTVVLNRLAARIEQRSKGLIASQDVTFWR